MANQIQHKAFQTSFDETSEGLVKAFVSVYGNVDSANEICDYGCFKDSLEYKYPVFCLYHNWELPIGKVIVAEEIPAGDERLPEDLKQWGGLYVEAQINLDKEIGRDAWSDIKQGVLDEYSIGYVVQEDFIDKEGYRHLTKVDLIEASPVVRAANRKTKTIEVKSEIFDEETKEPYVPNEGMKEEAARALAWKEEGRRGGTRIGLTRANQIVNGENLSEETVKRMFSYFSRHEVDKQAEGFSPGEAGYPSPGRVAWGLWGGDAGFSWSRNIVEGLDNESQDNSQINTKQMKELLDQIQEYLAGVMSPIDELKTQLASAGILEDEGIAEPLAAMEEPLQASLGFLEELTLNLAEMGYLDTEEPNLDSYNEDEEEDKKEEETVEVKALDLQQVMGLLSEIISLAENAMTMEMEWEEGKSIDNITTQIIGLMNVVQTELDNPTGEVDLQAMVDAFAVVNANVTELIAEAEALDPELNPNIPDYIATLQSIGGIATQLTEIVMAEMEAPAEEAEQTTDDESKAVETTKVDLKEQIELEQLFNNYLQSQFNIN